jgi:hypothetical protein
MNNFEVNDIDKQQKEDSLRRWKDAVIVKVMDKFQHIIGDEGFTEFKEFTKFYNNNTEFSDFFIIDYFFSNMEKFELKYLCYDQDYLNKFSQALSEFVGARVIEIVKACIKEVKSDKKFSEGFNFNPKKSSYFKIVGGNKDVGFIKRWKIFYESFKSSIDIFTENHDKYLICNIELWILSTPLNKICYFCKVFKKRDEFREILKKKVFTNQINFILIDVHAIFDPKNDDSYQNQLHQQLNEYINEEIRK